MSKEACRNLEQVNRNLQNPRAGLQRPWESLQRPAEIWGDLEHACKYVQKPGKIQELFALDVTWILMTSNNSLSINYCNHELFVVDVRWSPLDFNNRSQTECTESTECLDYTFTYVWTPMVVSRSRIIHCLFDWTAGLISRDWFLWFFCPVLDSLSKCFHDTPHIPSTFSHTYSDNITFMAHFTSSARSVLHFIMHTHFVTSIIHTIPSDVIPPFP